MREADGIYDAYVTAEKGVLNDGLNESCLDQHKLAWTIPLSLPASLTFSAQLPVAFEFINKSWPRSSHSQAASNYYKWIVILRLGLK